MKKFIITIDTEGDNLWAWKHGQLIKTENTLFLDRFQKLANEYGFKPTWLTNYEMIQDDRYVEFIQKVVANKQGELGMHLHAWNNPPQYDLPIINNAAPYLIEYPRDVMDEKIAFLTEYIIDRTGIVPRSHRAGRWATNDDYMELLIKYGYDCDCSVTPHIDWGKNKGQTEGSCGSNYARSSEKPYLIRSLLEIPMTVKICHRSIGNAHYGGITGAIRSFKNKILGKKVWLRPNGKNVEELKWILDNASDDDSDYVMFMLHSSEMMPGGSPNFQTSQSIEKLYDDLKELFFYAAVSYEGITLSEYCDEWKREKND